jgi:hypothetical protein
MSGEEPGTTDESVPKLTIGQRVLASLPNLERQRSGVKGRAASGADTRTSEVTPIDEKRDRSAAFEKAIEPDEVISPGDDAQAGSGTHPGRLRDMFLKPSPAGQGARKKDPTSKMSNEELTHVIKRLDDRERFYALFAGPLGAAIGIVLTAGAIHYNPAVGHKGHTAENLILFEGVTRVVLGGVVVLTALTRRRSLVGFTLLFFGTTVLPYGVLFWGLGGWMVWRVFRYQKVLTARGVGPQRGGARGGRRSTQNPRGAARTGATDARDRARERRAAGRDRARGRKKPEPIGPPPSKRYTPPKPTRPRPSAPS